MRSKAFEYQLFSRSWRTVALFVAMTGLQAGVAAVSIQLLSAVRAYVTGESLYSKGQKDAQIYLLNYADRHREEDYERFIAALAVPLGARTAREALQQREPDTTRAARGFIEGGNHPDDIQGLIRLFGWFQHVPYMSRPIATWTEGDRVIEQMRVLVDRARERILAGEPGAPAVTEMRRQAPVLNDRLTRLESDFSAQLGEASRTTQRLLLGVNAGIAGLLIVMGLGFVRRSAMKQASTEAEVIDRQQSLQRLLDSAVEGLFGVDLAGRCTFVNKSALSMLGYATESELLGRDMHSLIHHSSGDGQSHSVTDSKIQLAYRTGEALHAADEVFWRRDGTCFPVEYWSHPVIHDGAVQGAVATFFNISERVEMQAALRRGEARLARLIDAVTDGVVTMDDDGKIVLFNAAAETMFGAQASEAIGSGVGTFITTPIALPNQAADLAAAPDLVDGLVGPLHELVGKRRDGTTFPIEASLSRLETDRGQLTTVVLRDVSVLHTAIAERRARQALEAANLAKTEFLSRMSHELRTPLNAVIGFSQLLRMDAAESLSADQLLRVRHIESAGEHLLALVNDVLDLSRIESGEMHVLHDPIALSEVVEEATTMISPLVTEAAVEIFISSGTQNHPRHDLFNPPPVGVQPDTWVRADRVRLRQVLVNLLSNAVKYNRPGGSVALTWVEKDDECLISIVDTGQGILPEHLANLFEPFNRLGAEATKVEGTGIGLVLSRQLAEMMGGTLNIASAFGEGTVATLRLRLAAPPRLGAPAPRNLRLASGAVRELNVLYAEDNEVNAELMRQIVRLRPGVSLRVAESGSSALESATLDPPDLMLIDMNLGDMTGIGLARLLHRDRSTRQIPLIALSADALPEQVDAAMRCGFEAYMTKPINFQELLTVLDDYARVV